MEVSAKQETNSIYRSEQDHKQLNMNSRKM